ncbi:MAG TPA: PGPGW domain-containing protein [Geminicoccus sp.]|jgi:uncharacterized membrane protein YbaN (DUF454 family)|uniref:PGPGW domain-containing protein n=2 Tax=Bacteria TaxID=2 RepID=UPI002E318F4A|nr:PGPGW domain-containing protein [Geminicoccus sp.]HEX2527046.1 PGPGW domain-containing protein [Geminicoccus sp.]
MTRIVTLVLGYSFLVLGVLGLVLPFLQGFLFIFIGLILLSKHASWANRSLGYIRGRWPAMGRMIEQAEGMAERWIDKCTNGVRWLVGRA